MYQNARRVVSSLIIIFVCIIAAAVVAAVDPFDNGGPWINWLTLSVFSTITVITSTTVATSAKSEADFWGGHPREHALLGHQLTDVLRHGDLRQWHPTRVPRAGLDRLGRAAGVAADHCPRAVPDRSRLLRGRGGDRRKPASGGVARTRSIMPGEYHHSSLDDLMPPALIALPCSNTSITVGYTDEPKTAKSETKNTLLMQGIFNTYKAL